MWSDCDVRSLVFRIPVLWSSLAFKQRSNRTKQNHELTNQHNQHTVPLFNRSLNLSSKFAMARLLAVVGLVIFLSIHWGAPFLGQEPNARLPTPESPQVSNLVIANYVLAASLIFSANTIKEATQAQTEELVTINKQLVAISAQINSFETQINSFETTSEQAKFLINSKYETDTMFSPLLLLVALVLGPLYFVVQVWRNKNRNRGWPY